MPAIDREKLIDELVQFNVTIAGNEEPMQAMLAALWRHGFVGFENLSDDDLKREHDAMLLGIQVSDLLLEELKRQQY